MREIKFRAFVGGTMVSPAVWINEENLPCYSLSQAPRHSLMQYTGLKDKNGVEIYEGDIIDGVILSDYSIHIGRVLFDFNGYRIVTKEKSLPLDLPEKLTVIGNIHQNPELLNA